MPELPLNVQAYAQLAVRASAILAPALAPWRDMSAGIEADLTLRSRQRA